jgi:hypothetical protein
MGMFDKDKEIGLLLTSAFNQGEQFVLWNAYIDREDFPTQYGPVPRASLDVSKIDNQRAGQKFTVNSVASAVVAKVRDAERDDFPAVVFWRKAPSPDPNTVADPAMAAMAGQVEMAWQMMLGQATAAGFTREQIISLTLDTAATILHATATALWPDGTTPGGEEYARYIYKATTDDLRNDAVNWQARSEPGAAGYRETDT